MSELEPNELLTVWHTVIEMLSDRGYYLPPAYFQVTVVELEHLCRKNRLDIIIIPGVNDEGRSTKKTGIWVNFSFGRPTPTFVRSAWPIMDAYLTHTYGKQVSFSASSVDLICVCSSYPTKLAELSTEFSNLYPSASILFMLMRSLRYNPVKNYLQPKIRALTAEEGCEVLRTLAANTSQLPIIFSDSEVIRWYGYKPGTILACYDFINNVQSPQVPYYRIVKAKPLVAAKASKAKTKSPAAKKGGNGRKNKQGEDQTEYNDPDDTILAEEELDADMDMEECNEGADDEYGLDGGDDEYGSTASHDG